MDLVNCCGHDIDIMTTEGKIVSIPPGESMVRLVIIDDIVDNFDTRDGAIQIRRQRYRDSKLLPPRIEGTLYIVPRQVALVYAGTRDDFIYPDTHRAVWKPGTNTPEYVPGLRFPAVLEE